MEKIAAPRHRREDLRLLTGKGRFVGDIALEASCIGLAVRSDYPHAEIRDIRIEDACQLHGVHAVLTAHDLVAQNIGAIPGSSGMNNADGSDIFAPSRPVLAVERVRHVGEPVAFIVADSAAIAADAAELIDIDYRELPATSDLKQAAAGDPVIWNGDPANHCFDWQLGDAEAVAAEFAKASHCVEIEVANPRMAICPLEPRAAVGIYDSQINVYTLHAQTQGVHSVRDTLADSVLKIDRRQLQVKTSDVGGSFGMKIFTYPEYALVLIAARMVGRPVKWVASRTESFVSDTHGRARIDTARMAFDANGRMLALEYRALGDLGAYASRAGALVPSVYAATVVGHTYKIAHMHFHAQGVFTNTPPSDAYRGAGKPETTSTIEQLIDKAAHQIGIDRIELRRINLIRAGELPYSMPNGQVIDSGDFPALLNRALELSDWERFPERRKAAELAGMRRGIGLGMYMHSTGGSTSELSEVAISPNGTVRVLTGTQAGGQGHESALAALVSAHLEVDESCVQVVQGDTDAFGHGSGTGGSSLIAIAGATVTKAARRALDGARKAAGEILEVSAADLEYSRGEFRVSGTDVGISLAAIARHCDEHPSRGSCVGQAQFEGLNTTHPSGAYVAELECDPLTGSISIVALVGVDDLGRVLFPDMVDGQLHGAWAQSIGAALMESARYDDDAQGQPMNASFMDYALPRADDMPSFTLDRVETMCKVNALGAKGAGEVACLGAPGALFNALSDLLSARSFVAFSQPATPMHVWNQLHANTQR